MSGQLCHLIKTFIFRLVSTYQLKGNVAKHLEMQDNGQSEVLFNCTTRNPLNSVGLSRKPQIFSLVFAVRRLKHWVLAQGGTVAPQRDSCALCDITKCAISSTVLQQAMWFLSLFRATAHWQARGTLLLESSGKAPQ